MCTLTIGLLLNAASALTNAICQSLCDDSSAPAICSTEEYYRDVCIATEGCEWDSDGDIDTDSGTMPCSMLDAYNDVVCCVGDTVTPSPTTPSPSSNTTAEPTPSPTCPTEEECSEYDSAECCAADSDCYYDYDGYDIWDVPCSSEDAMAGTCCVQLTTAEPTENPTDFPSDLPSSEPTESPTTSQPTSAEPTASPT